MKKMILLALVVIAAYAGVSYTMFRKNVARGVGLVGEARPFERLRPGAPMRILVAGDSNTQGVGAKNPENSNPARLGALFPDAEVINLSRSGRRIREMRTVFEEKKQEIGRFDLILFQIGGNDITHFTPLSDIETDLRALLSSAKEISQKVLILHTGDLGRSPIFPWPVNWIMSWETQRVREIYLRVTKETDTHYVDLYGARVDDEFHTDTYRYYATDRFHLADDGYGVWHREIVKLLQ